MPFILKVILAVLAGTAAYYDIRFRRVPNWLTLSGLFLGFGVNLVLFHMDGFALTIEGMLVAFTIYFPFYLIRGMGAGDVKLMAAIGSLAGPRGWLIIFIYTALLGALSGVLLSLIRGRFTETCLNVRFALVDMLHLRAPYKTNAQMDVRTPDGLRMPHAVFISVGCVAFLAGVVKL